MFIPPNNLPDVRNKADIFSKVKTAICGLKSNKKCLWKNKECNLYCVRQTKGI